MKTILIKSSILISLILLNISIFSQNKITLSHLGTPAFYTNLTTAITAAVNGDTIYLPGGTIAPTSSDISVNKALHLIGAGHYPDSTSATGRTIITTLRFVTGSGGGSLQGCVLSNLYIGYANTQSISGLTVSRCKIDNFRLGYDAASTLDNIYLTENVFAGDFIIHTSYQNILIIRNIFNFTSDRGGQSLLFKNNIFYDNNNYPDYGALSGFINCIFENNIIISTTSSNLQIVSSYSNFNKNMFIPGVSDWGTNVQQNSLLNQTLTSTFENAPGTSFSYGHNYHLKSTCPGKNYGTDGTDIGIFGTSSPYKDGAVPFNPHIFSKNISGQTTPQGILNVNISVSAQDR
jgi:hypothetical protein